MKKTVFLYLKFLYLILILASIDAYAIIVGYTNLHSTVFGLFFIFLTFLYTTKALKINNVILYSCIIATIGEIILSSTINHSYTLGTFLIGFPHYLRSKEVLFTLSKKNTFKLLFYISIFLIVFIFYFFLILLNDFNTLENIANIFFSISLVFFGAISITKLLTELNNTNALLLIGIFFITLANLGFTHFTEGFIRNLFIILERIILFFGEYLIILYFIIHQDQFINTNN